MPIIECADIDTNGAAPYVFNAIVIMDVDYDFMASIWSSFFPGRYIAPIWDLPPASGYAKPVWIGWVQGEDGLWSDPTRPPVDP